jgi:hypothetical protein
MSQLRAVVDRIEGTMAVLLIGSEEHQAVVPRNLLPQDAGEGAVIRITIDVDFAATEEAKRRVQDQIDRLSIGESG